MKVGRRWPRRVGMHRRQNAEVVLEHETRALKGEACSTACQAQETVSVGAGYRHKCYTV